MPHPSHRTLYCPSCDWTNDNRTENRCSIRTQSVYLPQTKTAREEIPANVARAMRILNWTNIFWIVEKKIFSFFYSCSYAIRSLSADCHSRHSHCSAKVAYARATIFVCARDFSVIIVCSREVVAFDCPNLHIYFNWADNSKTNEMRRFTVHIERWHRTGIRSGGFDRFHRRAIEPLKWSKSCTHMQPKRI